MKAAPGGGRIPILSSQAAANAQETDFDEEELEGDEEKLVGERLTFRM